MNDKKVAFLTIHYTDGTREEVREGLLAHMPDAETVLMRVSNLDGPTVMTILAAFQGCLELPPDEVIPND